MNGDHSVRVLLKFVTHSQVHIRPDRQRLRAPIKKVYIHFCVIIMEASLRFPAKAGFLTGGRAPPCTGGSREGVVIIHNGLTRWI